MEQRTAHYSHYAPSDGEGGRSRWSSGQGEDLALLDVGGQEAEDDGGAGGGLMGSAGEGGGELEGVAGEPDVAVGVDEGAFAAEGAQRPAKSERAGMEGGRSEKRSG
jgi:hypothetical protein